jgi:hypothetical protein
MTTENNLMVLGDSPIEAVATEKVKAMAERVRTLVQDGHKLSGAQALTIAQMSILTRTLPGRDVHYFLDQNGNLKMSDDYKFLRAWAVRREQFVTGDQAATFEDVYTELDDTAKLREGISPNDFAVYCTLTTKRERDNFRREVKGWIDLGFTPDEAVNMARSVLGTIGTRAVGVVNANDGLTNSNGESKKVPKGWSLMQKARKLAFKNAVHAKWGQPSIDDTQQMVKAMARGEVIEADWEEVPTDVSAEEQARYAEGNAIARKVKAESEAMTPGQRQERKAVNTEVMRGDNDSGIGATDWERFIARVKKDIPYFTTEGQIRLALAGLEYHPEIEDECFDELAVYANRQADLKAG